LPKIHIKMLITTKSKSIKSAGIKIARLLGTAGFTLFMPWLTGMILTL